MKESVTIQSAIKAAFDIVEARKQAAYRASDEDVGQRIVTLAQQGYEPSDALVEAVRDYLSGYSLLLTGPAGVGKTFLMQCLGVRRYSAESIIDYGLARIRDWYDWTDGHDICIDDVGSERMVAEYGAKDEVLRAVIAHRSDRQRGKRGKTHVTTNLTAEQISARYGDRILSRLMGMCKAHALTGPSRRRAEQAKGGES